MIEYVIIIFGIAIIPVNYSYIINLKMLGIPQIKVFHLIRYYDKQKKKLLSSNEKKMLIINIYLK